MSAEEYESGHSLSNDTLKAIGVVRRSKAEERPEQKGERTAHHVIYGPTYFLAPSAGEYLRTTESAGRRERRGIRRVKISGEREVVQTGLRIAIVDTPTMVGAVATASKVAVAVTALTLNPVIGAIAGVATGIASKVGLNFLVHRLDAIKEAIMVGPLRKIVYRKR